MSSIEDNIISVHLMKTLHRMRENGEFCDLVFELNNSKFSAHQLVMAVWSPPMKNLLQLQPASTQHVRVAYDKPEDFQKFITFLYTGILPEQTTNILAVLNIAATFQIHILTELCKTYLKTNTTEDNVINMCHLSMKFKLHDLERHCVEFVCQHMTKIVQNQEFRDLTLIQINSLLGSDYMTKLEPEIKLFLIISWLAEDVHSREHVFVLLLKHVDWSLVAIDYLKEIIETENFFTANPSSLYLLLQTIDSSSFSLGPYENHLWTLRQQYSSLLSNVINNCAAIDLNKTQPFQPLSFSLVVSPNEELYSPDQNMVTTKTVGIKNELLQIVDFDKTYAHDDTVDSGILQSQMNSSLNMPISTLNTPECRNGNETSSYTQISEKCLLSKSASVPSITVEGSMKRKFLRPHKIVTNTVVIKKQSLKVRSNRNKKIVSKLHNTRGRLQGKVTSNENVLRFVDNEISTEDFKTNDKNRTVMKNVTAVRKENVRRKDLRKHHGSKGTVKYLSVAKGLEDTVHVEDSSDQQMNQGETDLKVQERKKILQRLSLRNNRAKRARNTGSDLKKTLNQRKEIRRKDSKLQIQKCNECTFTTYNPVMLDKHQKQVHEGNCLFCCSLCSFKTKWGKDYYGHMKKSHFPGPPFCCDEEKCDYNTDKFPELISHRQQHHDQRPFVCDICLTAFRSKNNLYQHIKIHSDEKRFQCPECSRFFKLKITLDQHMVTHSDLRPYLCDLCGFSTKFQSHLICHKRIHTGDVYRCNFPSCSYSTPKKSQLTAHMRSHLGIRRHVCSTCGKAFVEKSHLVRHERGHSLERAYICKDCSYSSTRSDKLREHIQKHHSDEAVRIKATSSKQMATSEIVTVSTTPKENEDYKNSTEAPGLLKIIINDERNAKQVCEALKKAGSHWKSEGKVMAPSPESFIEVVVMKSAAKLSNNSAETEAVLPDSLAGGEDIVRLVQGLPFQALVSQHDPASLNASMSTASKMENLICSGFTRTLNNEKDGLDELIRRELDLADIPETGVGYQMQTRITGATKDLSSGNFLGDHSVAAYRSVSDNKATTGRGIINVNYQKQIPNTNVTYTSYSMLDDFSKPSSQCEQGTFKSQENLQLGCGPHQFITMPSPTSSTVTQQYYHP